MVTLNDVAKKAGVSPTTVSRILNNRGYIGEKTRKRVESAMKELNYHPNQIARSLLSRKSHLFAVLVPDSSNPFFCELVKYIERECAKNDYRLLLCNSFDDHDTEVKYLQILQGQNIDGLISCSHLLDLNKYQSISFPIVSFDKCYFDNKTPMVSSNNNYGGMLAAKHLIEKGRRRLLHISGPLTDTSLLGHGRFYGFKDYCDRKGVFYENVSTNNHFGYDYYFSFIEKEIGDHVLDFDGAFCSNDLIAYALYGFLQKKQIRVPEQFSIIGFDHTEFSRTLFRPKLTTIEQDIPAIAHKLVETLISIQNGNPPKEIITTLDVKLILGETT